MYKREDPSADWDAWCEDHPDVPDDYDEEEALEAQAEREAERKAEMLEDECHRHYGN